MTLLHLLSSLPSLQNCVRTSPTKYVSRDLSFNVDESDSEEEAYTSFFRHHLQSSRRPNKRPASKENASESKEPAAVNKASVRKKSSGDEKMTSEERETSPVTGEESGANVAGQTMLKSLIGEMEANLLREFSKLKSDIGARQNAVESRLDIAIG